MAFLCVDTNAPDKLTQPESQLKPLAACTPTPLDQPENLFSLHALVTQSSRGEVAAVEVVAVGLEEETDLLDVLEPPQAGLDGRKVGSGLRHRGFPPVGTVVTRRS